MTEIEPRAGRREWIGLTVLVLPSVLYAMDLTVLYLAVPSLTEDLQPNGPQLLWITDIYGFATASLLVATGTLGDRIGRRKLLLIGAAGFGLASLLAAFSTSALMLIVARGLLGVCAATLAPSTLSLIRNMFADEGQRKLAIGVWASSYSVGGLIAPLVGGILLENFWWGSVFLLAAPVTALLLVVGPLLLPEYKDPEPRPFDIPSALLSLVSVLGVIYGIKQLAAAGSLDARSIVAILCGLVLGSMFIDRQRRIDDPMVDLRLFRAPEFGVSLGATALSLFLLLGLEFLLQQYLQLVLGLDPFEAGLWLLPPTGVFIVVAMLTPALARRVRPAIVVAGGLLVAAAGAGALTMLRSDSGVALPVASWVVMAAGTAPVITLSTDLVVGSAPPERAGTASGLSETGNELGAALGIAILGSVVNAVYQGRLSGTVADAVSPRAANAAKDTLGGAKGVAGQLPESLLQAASSAFSAGLRLAALTSAALALGMAALTWLFLVRRRAYGTQSGEEAEAPAAPELDRHSVER